MRNERCPGTALTGEGWRKRDKIMDEDNNIIKKLIGWMAVMVNDETIMRRHLDMEWSTMK